MDSHQFFRYGMTGADLSYSSSYKTIPSISTRLFASLNFDSSHSPNSTFSTQFDSETLDSEQNFSGSPSCNTSLDSYFSKSENRGQNMNYTLQELETNLMGPDNKEEEVLISSSSLGESKGPQMLDRSLIQAQPHDVFWYGKSGEELHSEKWLKTMEEASLQGISPGNLKQLLIACARALSENKLNDFENLIEKARDVVSIRGEPIQRLGAYMIEGLVARKDSSGLNVYRTLRCKEPQGKDLLSYMHILYEICPYLKFGYLAANGAIAEACRNEDRIHIIDFQIVQGTQWLTLLQALAARPGGAPYVRITGIDDPVSKHARGADLDMIGKHFATISEKFNIPVEFHPVSVFPPDVTRDMLDVKPGEAVVVNFPLQLHHTPDESVDVNNPRDELLRMVKSLSPKVTTLVEQESNTNTAPFFPRFLETLDYYSAIFDSIDLALPRDKKVRINVEQHCLGRDIVNIIACEGKDRVERHELLGKWKLRLTMAGFTQGCMNPYVNSVIRSLLRCYSEHYTLVEKDGAMLLGWKERNLISASAWY